MPAGRVPTRWVWAAMLGRPSLVRHKELQPLRTGHATLLALNHKGTVALGANLETVEGRSAVRQGQVESDAEVGRVSSGSPTHRLNATPVPQGLLQSGIESVRYEPQRVKEVALAGTVGPDQERQRPKVDSTPGDALVVGDGDRPNKGRHSGHRLGLVRPRFNYVQHSPRTAGE